MGYKVQDLEMDKCDGHNESMETNTGPVLRLVQFRGQGNNAVMLIEVGAFIRQNMVCPHPQ